MLPGMPLGALGTGYIGLGTDGTLDQISTIFNEHLRLRSVGSNSGSCGRRDEFPTRRRPFLAIANCGKVTALSLKPINGVQPAKDIHYWGHYPIADLEYELDGPIGASLRAWTPFLPGDSTGSNTPGAVFELRLRNHSGERQTGTVAFSFPGPGPHKAGSVYEGAALNGRPGVRFTGNGSETVMPTGPKHDAVIGPGGDCAFTVFFVGIVNKSEHRDLLKRHPVSWGLRRLWKPLCGSAIEIDCTTDSLNWATSGDGSANALTAPGSFKDCYGKPVVICVRKRPGPINETTTICVNGAALPLIGTSSSATPDIEATQIRLGGNAFWGQVFLTPRMVAGEVVTYDEALPDEQMGAVGLHLAKKYGLSTSYPASLTPLAPDEAADVNAWFKADDYAGLKDGDAVPAEQLSLIGRAEIAGDGLTGVTVRGERDGYELGYTLAVAEQQAVRCGGALGENAGAWNKIGSMLPAPGEGDLGATVAVDFSLEPGQSRSLHFILAWYAPLWLSEIDPQGEGLSNFPPQDSPNTYMNMYATRFRNSTEVAGHLAHHRESLLQRTLNWQQAIYSERNLPGWLHDALINVLAVLPQNSFLIKSPDPGHWWGEEGFFCVNECLVCGPQQTCMGNDQFGDWPVNLLFPELALRKLKAFKHYQKPDTGQPPSTLGPKTEPDNPRHGQQKSMDGQNCVHMVDRCRLAMGDDGLLDEWYAPVKGWMKYMFSRDLDGIGIPDCDGQYMDAWNVMEGAAAHVTSYWLATLRIAERMARQQGDEPFADECRSWLERADRFLEEHLWNDQVGSYLLWNRPSTGSRSDTVIPDQLSGPMFARLHDLPDVMPADRVKRIMATLEQLNVAATPYGIHVAVRPDGRVDPSCWYSTIPSYSTLVPASVMVAGGDPHFEQLGIEIARRTWHNMVIRQNMAWDMPAHVAEDGSTMNSLEYYHNSMLWVLPLCVLKEDIGTACTPGGFVDRILRAASANN